MFKVIPALLVGALSFACWSHSGQLRSRMEQSGIRADSVWALRTPDHYHAVWNTTAACLSDRVDSDVALTDYHIYVARNLRGLYFSPFSVQPTVQRFHGYHFRGIRAILIDEHSLNDITLSHEFIHAMCSTCRHVEPVFSIESIYGCLSTQ